MQYIKRLSLRISRRINKTFYYTLIGYFNKHLIKYYFNFISFIEFNYNYNYNNINKMIRNSTLARINSFIGAHREIVIHASVKLYTANKIHEKWLYSDLSGALCFVFDFKEKARYFILYDLTSFEVLFKFQLYFEFDKYYQILSETFHSFEIDGGIIGIKFDDRKEANKYTLNIIKYDDMQTIQYFKSKNNEKKQEKTNLIPFTQKCFFLQSNIMSQLKLDFNQKHNCDKSHSMTVSYLRRFALLMDFSYNKQKKQFNLDDVSQGTKNFLKSIGVKKSDLRNTHLALIFFKQILQTLQGDGGVEVTQPRKRSRISFNKHSHKDSGSGNSNQSQMAKRYTNDAMIIKNFMRETDSI